MSVYNSGCAASGVAERVSALNEGEPARAGQRECGQCRRYLRRAAGECIGEVRGLSVTHGHRLEEPSP